MLGKLIKKCKKKDIRLHINQMWEFKIKNLYQNKDFRKFGTLLSRYKLKKYN